MSRGRCGVRLGFAFGLAVAAMAAVAAFGSLSTALGAQTVQACAIPNPEQTSQEAKTDWMRAFFRGLFEVKSDPAAVGADAPELYFTNISGYSGRPRCDPRTGAAIGYFNHLYYPVGLVVRKVGEVKLGRNDFLLVETEYALRTFIRKSNLSPLEADAVYFFSNGVQLPKGYCLGQSDEPCTSDAYLAGRRIDPQSRYARASAADFAAAGHALDVNYIGAAADLACGVVKVAVHGRTRRADPEPSLQERVRLNTCVDQGVPIEGNDRVVSSGTQILDPGIKIVRRGDYESYFTKRIASSLMRVDAGLIASVAPEFSTQKKCNTVLKFESGTSYSIQGSVGAKFLSALEIGGEAAKKYMHNFAEQLGGDVAIQLLTYDLVTEDGLGRVEGAPIQIRFGCDTRNSAPQSAYEIRISHPSSAVASDFVIAFKTVNSDAERTDALTISSQNKSALFDQGYVFLIEGPNDYFPVRDRIFGLIRQLYQDKLQELYADAEDRVYFHRLANFITHLVITAAGKPAPRDG